MSTQREVEHILTERLDDDYARTLCGKIILNPSTELGKLPHRGSPAHPTLICQKCLRRHYNVKRKP